MPQISYQTLADIRNLFLSYFARNGHNIQDSASITPVGDKSLLFTNAGMVPFKDVFAGRATLKDDAGAVITKAASAQKCIRAGGKHNDLENVGYTARHHTFFEMMGNFSFGDYFKEQAIILAYNLITQELGLPKDRLFYTVHKADEESYKLWQKIVPSDRIIQINTDDNYWSMGDVGPCGYCSEIFYDHGEHIEGGLPGSANEDGDRYIEIYNLVFMQFEKYKPVNAQNMGAKNIGGEILQKSLPKPSIDTGMGLERITAVMQGVHNNYDIDLFKNLINASKEIVNDASSSNYGGSYGANYGSNYGRGSGDICGDIATSNNFSHRVITDHLRSASFLLAERLLPSNEGRGYVLRRIMRRGMRHLFKLGTKEAVMHKLVPILVEQMGVAYPELKKEQNFITQNIKEEEERFRQTIERGMAILDEEIQKLKNASKYGGMLNGDVAFKLYDTFGFPLDLTADILREQNMKIDEEGFNKNMLQQKLASKNASSFVINNAEGASQFDESIYKLAKQYGKTEFLGYSEEKTDDATIIGLFTEGGKHILVVDKTPLYAESGGQAGDRGIAKLVNASKDVAEATEAADATEAAGDITILDVKKHKTGVFLHIIEQSPPLKEVVTEKGQPAKEAIAKKGVKQPDIFKNLKIGDKLSLHTDMPRRDKLACNHSATHILHKALQNILGEHVTQKGSLVEQDYLRFDFSHKKPVSQEELDKITTQVNAVICQNTTPHIQEMPLEQAKQAGAMALFGEKYDKKVRVVTMGQNLSEAYSTELCGGTHVHSTGLIGLFTITRESAVSAGIRRIEAITGGDAFKYIAKKQQMLSKIVACLKTSEHEAEAKAQAIMKEFKAKEKQIAQLKKQLALATGGTSHTSTSTSYAINRASNTSEGEYGGAKNTPDTEQIGDIKLIFKIYNDIAGKDLRGIMDGLKKQHNINAVIILISECDGKVAIAAGITDDLTDKLDASMILKQVVAILGGKGGGGRKDFAQGGAKHIHALPKAKQKVRQMLNLDFS